MGKLISRGLLTEAEMRRRDGFVLNYGRALKLGSKDHKAAIADAQRKGDWKEARKLLGDLPGSPTLPQ
jgi:hypothetical protein